MVPASKGKGPTYDPQADAMVHDSVFKELVPGASSSGLLKYKWGTPEGHTKLSAPPSGLKSE